MMPYGPLGIFPFWLEYVVLLKNENSFLQLSKGVKLIPYSSTLKGWIARRGTGISDHNGRRYKIRETWQPSFQQLNFRFLVFLCTVTENFFKDTSLFILKMSTFLSALARLQENGFRDKETLARYQGSTKRKSLS